jgi:phosphoribosylaminoimidazole (AIR) synthetase
LHNFNRAGEGVEFHITDPLEPLPIHYLLIQESGWNPETAYVKQNMGIGFVYIFPDRNMADAGVTLINQRGENNASIIGEVRAGKPGADLKTVLHKPYEGKGPLDFVGYSN